MTFKITGMQFGKSTTTMTLPTKAFSTPQPRPPAFITLGVKVNHAFLYQQTLTLGVRMGQTFKTPLKYTQQLSLGVTAGVLERGNYTHGGGTTYFNQINPQGVPKGLPTAVGAAFLYQLEPVTPTTPKFAIVNATAGRPFGTLMNDDGGNHVANPGFGDWGLTLHGDPYLTGFGLHVFSCYNTATADGAHGCALFINQGDGTWVFDPRFTPVSYVHSAMFVDLDQDGVEEFLTARFPGRITGGGNGVFNVWKFNGGTTAITYPGPPSVTIQPNAWGDVALAWGINPAVGGPRTNPHLEPVSSLMTGYQNINAMACADLGQLNVTPYTPSNRLSLTLWTAAAGSNTTISFCQVWTNYGTNASPAFQEESGPRGLQGTGGTEIYGVKFFDIGDGTPTIYTAGNDGNFWVRMLDNNGTYRNPSQNPYVNAFGVNNVGLHGLQLPNLPPYAFDIFLVDTLRGNPTYHHQFEQLFLSGTISLPGYKGPILALQGGGSGMDPSHILRRIINTGAGQSGGTANSGLSDTTQIYSMAGHTVVPQEMAWGDFNNDGFLDIFVSVGNGSNGDPTGDGADLLLLQGKAFGTADNATPNVVPFQWGMQEHAASPGAVNSYAGTPQNPGLAAGVAGPGVEYPYTFVDGGYVGAGGSCIAEDWDKNGTMDLLVAYSSKSVPGPWNIFKNITPSANLGNWIGVIPRGPLVIGARIQITDSLGNQWQETMDDGTGWRRQAPRQWHFGLGLANGPATVTVTFPGGTTQTATVAVNHWYICNATGGAPVSQDTQVAVQKLNHTGGTYPEQSANQIENAGLIIRDRALLFLAWQMKTGAITYGDANFQRIFLLAENAWSAYLFQHHYTALLPNDPNGVTADDTTVVAAIDALITSFDNQVNSLQGPPVGMTPGAYISPFSPEDDVNGTLFAQTNAIINNITVPVFGLFK